MRVIFTTAQGKNAKLRWSRFWRFLSFRKAIHRHNPALFVEVNLKRLFVTLGLLLVLAYFIITAALAVFFGNRPHSPVTYWDVAWPGNWDTIRPKQGQMLIAQADEYFEQGKLREAFSLYRSGLRMYPEDQDARLILAKMLAGANMVERAGDVLAEGLDYGYPENEEYLAVLLQIISIQQNQQLLTQIVPKLLQAEEIAGDPKKKYALLQQYMQAQLLSGDYLGAIATAESTNADPDAPQKAHNVILAGYIRMDATDQALDYYQGLDEETQKTPAMLLLYASALAQSGQTDAMMAVLRNLFREYPSAWRVQLSALQLILRFGQPKQSEAYMELYLNTHLGNLQALNALAVFLTDMPDSQRMGQMLTHIQKQRPIIAPTFEFFLVQALITEGKFQQAKKLYQAWLPKVPADSEERSVIEAFGLILSAATDGGLGARAELLDNLRQNRYPPEVYWEASLAMTQAGYDDTALEILNIASNLYPTHPSLANMRERLTDPDAARENRLNDHLTKSLGPDSGNNYSTDNANYNPGITEKDLEDNP